ncbi:MAG: hypothetical protein ACP5IL_01165 [Syntrophobacteraceae bacterium]
MQEFHQEDELGGEGQNCLLCSLIKTVRSAKQKQGAFYTHMYNARIEMLQAFRSLIDERIANLEKRKNPEEGKRATKIIVE